MQELSNMNRRTNKIKCAFKDKCINYGKYCHKCRFNYAKPIESYLELKGKDGKTVKFL